MGGYTITASGFSADNYEISYLPGTLTVKPRLSDDFSAEIVYEGNDRFFVYNGSEIHPVVRVTDRHLGAGSEIVLTEGTDYTLRYENAVAASLLWCA